MINTNEYFLDIADAVAKQSTCLDKAVGCVIVSQDNQIISCGYNGAPSKFPDCKSLGYCRKSRVAPGLCIATHAEINALLNAYIRGPAVMRISKAPCVSCAAAIANAGIKHVYYLEDYSCTAGLDLLAAHKIGTTKISIGGE